MDSGKRINILLGVTASVAAVKVPSLVNDLFESGKVDRIDLVVTDSAKHFLTNVFYKGKNVLEVLRSIQEKHCCSSDTVREADMERFGGESIFEITRK